MVTSKKRKRQAKLVDSSSDFLEASPPPPFSPSHVSLLKNYRSPLSRSLSSGLSPIFLNLAVTAGFRLQVHDHAAVAAILPTLLRRYRKLFSRWCFSREVAVSGATVLRRFPPPNASQDTLDLFLEHVASDPAAASPSLEGYAGAAREASVLERTIRFLANGAPQDAFNALSEQAELPSFRSCAIVQAYLGIVALAVAARDPDPTPRLRIAARALASAADLEPRAPFYAYYAAAVDLVTGRRDSAINCLRTALSRQQRDDPLILRALLACLETIPIQDGTGTVTNSAARQERVDVARRLLAVDPASVRAAETLKEALSWSWNVEPNVTRLELAEVFAGRIEHGDVGKTDVWAELGNCLCEEEADRTAFWHRSGRADWWTSHFFRPSRVNFEIARDPELAAVKAAVVRMLSSPASSDYADAVSASLPSESVPLSSY